MKIALIFILILLGTGLFHRVEVNHNSVFTELVGSTPGDSVIKSMLGIPGGMKVDFIRWNLIINQSGESGNFNLNLQYGKAKPNTLGFMNNGNELQVTGKFAIEKEESENLGGEIYHLSANNSLVRISLIKLTDCIYHLLTPDMKLMRGNGGWSYTLNRKGTEDDNISPALKTSSSIDTSLLVIYEGRTPCFPFPILNNPNSGESCIKIKWKLELKRDNETYLPAFFTLSTTFNRNHVIQGEWRIKKGLEENSDAIVIQLNPKKPGESISWLVGDENILFFMDSEQRLLTGNNNFSYTLNRRN